MPSLWKARRLLRGAARTFLLRALQDGRPGQVAPGRLRRLRAAAPGPFPGDGGGDGAARGRGFLVPGSWFLVLGSWFRRRREALRQRISALKLPRPGKRL